MLADEFKLTDEERDTIYTEKIYPFHFNVIKKSPSPSFHLLAGQSGAGKSVLQAYIRRNLAESPPIILK